MALLEELSNLQRQLHFEFDRSPAFRLMEDAVKNGGVMWSEYAVFYKAEQLRSNPSAARNYFNSITQFGDRVKIKDAAAPVVRDALAKGATMERYM